MGNLSREGKRRTREPIKALDHDYQCSEVLVPLGILDVRGGNFSIYFGTSAETSDFIVEIFSQPYVKVQFLKPRTKLTCGYDAQLVFILNPFLIVRLTAKLWIVSPFSGSSRFCVEGRRIGIIFQKYSLQSPA
ncbi:ISAzo13-like element transposase-related protein [Microcystis aeruginosa]|uniref:ISAzo13-like element transposase-related protein n=1 Tax=Microcystis aeruginosa TaxID=1126 RepID=UPI00232D171A|nr:hypothetical protein [Microcystis aeruginosa]MDB9392209.1 hypothetical protein [Microcystis aeruginosa CS-579]